MASKQQVAPVKGINPEARLQAAVARDIKLRYLDDHVRRQAESMSLAKWELNLTKKDALAVQHRYEEQIQKDSQVVKIINTQTRKKRLQQLYKDDELKYEQELNQKGLAFRRDRI